MKSSLKASAYFIVVVSTFLIGNLSIVNADVTHPYTVDEKIQVFKNSLVPYINSIFFVFNFS